MTRISLIYAVADNGVIGKQNALPWHIPQDLRHFKVLTLGKPMIVGRKTFESFGKPLPDRPNLVITQQADYHPEGAVVFSSLTEAIKTAQALAGPNGEIMIAGGAQIFEEAQHIADRIYKTEIHAQVEGDVFFTLAHPEQWTETSREYHPSEGATPALSFVTLARTSSGT